MAKLGWMFMNDGPEGIPYLKCPYCGRRVSGEKFLFAYEAYETCPTCEKELHFDNVSEENWLSISSYFGEDL